jgi:hypothetical protein
MENGGSVVDQVKAFLTPAKLEELIKVQIKIIKINF